MNVARPLSPSWLDIDPEKTARQIEASIRFFVHSRLKRKGVVLGLSGGIDSSVVAALCVNALDRSHVLGILMPERECSDDSRRLGSTLAQSLGIQTVLEDITPILEATGCYARRDDAIRKLVPDYGRSHKCKLVVPDLASGAQYSLPSLVVESPGGGLKKLRPSASVYLEIVAASNFKQRVRKMLEYYHADRLQYAVAGTPNRLEFDQGFFVKNGDGAADLKPIAHLYKSQVYQLAAFLKLPAEVCQRPSTTDTFSLPQSQEEFYFSVPLRILDLCLYGKNHGHSSQEIAESTGLTLNQVEVICDGIDSKRRVTAYMHEPALLAETIPEIAHAPVGNKPFPEQKRSEPPSPTASQDH